MFQGMDNMEPRCIVHVKVGGCDQLNQSKIVVLIVIKLAIVIFSLRYNLICSVSFIKIPVNSCNKNLWFHFDFKNLLSMSDKDDISAVVHIYVYLYINTQYCNNILHITRRLGTIATWY